jgi:hypothetical protein
MGEVTFTDLLTQVKKEPLAETRQETDDYFEAVVKAENIAGICRALELYFGPAFKPAGQVPTRDQAARVVHLGGIQKNQILYYVERENLSNCAMIWPWNDGTRSTLKIAQGLLRR